MTYLGGEVLSRCGHNGDPGTDAPLFHQPEEVPDIVLANAEDAQVEKVEEPADRGGLQVREEEDLGLLRTLQQAVQRPRLHRQNNLHNDDKI